MNMRSRICACAAKITSSSASRPEPMNIEFTKDFQKNEYKRLEGREVQTIKWACAIILNQPGLTNDFNLL
jgi:hypothetical protein